MAENDFPWDLEGWGEISSFLRMSERTARRYTKLKDDPLPVMRFGGYVRAQKQELRLWVARNTARRTDL